MAWADSHCHLHDSAVADPDGCGAVPVAAPIIDAVRVGVRRMITVGCDEATSRAAIAAAQDATAVAATECEVWATAGLHPHDAKDGCEPWLPELLASGFEARIVAVGECGLDYFYDHSPRDEQRAAFARQIGYAHDFDLPLVIHTRDAWDDTFAIFASEGVPRNVVFHCFTAGPAEAEKCLALDAYLSYSGIVTFKTAEDNRAALRITPMERLLIETDSPYLAPVPHRGEKNRPALIPVIGSFVAEVLETDIDTVQIATWQNTGTVFRLAEAERAVKQLREGPSHREDFGGRG